MRPTVTPALRTGARTFKPPMLSKRAVTVYELPLPTLPRLAALSARKTSPRMPSKTNSPTIVSIFFVAILGPHPVCHQGAENIKAVSTKSTPSTAKEEITTVRVVA